MIPSDARYFRHVLGHYPTGVCVVTAVEPDGTRIGMVVGSFTSVSLDPPLIGFFPDRTSLTWPRIEAAGRFCVNILAHDQRDLCARFAARGAHKFADLSHRSSPAGLPILDGVVAWIECGLHAVHPAGDHVCVLGDVRAMVADPANAPMLFLNGGYGRFAGVVA